MARQPKKSRSFEGLESRAMLAGHVNTLIDGSGNLMITGDKLANSISLQQVSEGSWEIVGFNTGINGRHSRVLAENVTGNISIDMGLGNDTLAIHDGSIDGNLSIVMGKGADRTSLQNLTIRDYLHYEGNAGNDSFMAKNVTVLDATDEFFSSIDTQDGNDKVILDNFNASNLATTLGKGNDTLKVTNSTFTGGESEHLSVDAGAGTDKVMLDSISAGALNVDMGDGNRDLLSIQRSLAKSSSLHGGAGVGDKLIQSTNLLGAPGGGSNLIDGFEKIA
jgi:hypothetical protein